MKNKPYQSGMTLIEIMIALLIGAFLLGGVLQIFIGSKQTNRMQEGLSRLQENGRFAMDFITKDIRMADFWGCLTGLTTITNNLDPSGTGYNTDIYGFAQGITGTNGAAGSNSALDVPDTISMRGASNTGITVETPYGPNTSSNIKISTNNGLAQGDIVLVSDCSQGDIFQISNANPNTGGIAVHNTGSATQPGNKNTSNPGCPGANAHCLSKVYQGDAAIFKLSTTTYSIQNGAGGQPSLYRKLDANAATELVEGIENLQILYGEDTDNDGTANYYVPAGTAGLNMDQVVSVRISLLARTIDNNLAAAPLAYTYNGATTTPGDRRLRRVFTSTIAIRNRLQ
jgi:type IV pilus assembly protein PilW